MTSDFDAKAIRQQLNAIRIKHGADTPIGHRCSNLIEQLENLQGATGDQRKQLEKNISRSVTELAAMNADHH